MFGLVNPNKSQDNVVLIGMKPTPNCFITMRALLAGKKAFNKIQADLDIIMQDHMKAHTSQDVNVFISSVYQVFGNSYSMTDWNETMKNEFAGFLKVEANWNSFSFIPPLMPASTTLVY